MEWDKGFEANTVAHHAYIYFDSSNFIWCLLVQGISASFWAAIASNLGILRPWGCATAKPKEHVHMCIVCLIACNL